MMPKGTVLFGSILKNEAKQNRPLWPYFDERGGRGQVVCGAGVLE